MRQRTLLLQLEQEKDKLQDANSRMHQQVLMAPPKPPDAPPQPGPAKPPVPPPEGSTQQQQRDTQVLPPSHFMNAFAVETSNLIIHCQEVHEVV
jgi:hypothetical protein